MGHSPARESKRGWGAPLRMVCQPELGLVTAWVSSPVLPNELPGVEHEFLRGHEPRPGAWLENHAAAPRPDLRWLFALRSGKRAAAHERSRPWDALVAAGLALCSDTRQFPGSRPGCNRADSGRWRAGAAPAALQPRIQSDWGRVLSREQLAQTARHARAVQWVAFPLHCADAILYLAGHVPRLCQGCDAELHTVHLTSCK